MTRNVTPAMVRAVSRMGRRAVLLCAALAAGGCADAEGAAEVAVTWSHPGRCGDVGADTFRLTVNGGETHEAPCDGDGIALRFDLGTTLTLSGELLSKGVPITERLDGGEFPVQQGGADVGFDFALEDFLKTADYRFKVVFQNEVGDVDCTTIDTQRARLRRRADESLVEGAEVCGPDGVCTPADGTAGPCRDRDEEQAIDGLDWGRYGLYLAGEDGASCYSREVEITVGLSLRTDEIVADLPCE